MLVNDRELTHHGILGQKWGVRRYQRRDGSLTRLGEKRFKEVRRNKYEQRKQSKKATKILAEAKRGLEREDRGLQRKIDRLSVRSEKSQNGSKLRKTMHKKEAVSNDIRVISEKLNGISNGTIKAGEDFIVARNVYKIPYVAIGITGPKVHVMSIGRDELVIRSV